MIGTGILIPNLAHRFVVQFRFQHSEEASDQLARQVVNCKMNYLKKTVTIDLEQPAPIADVHDVIFDSIVNSHGPGNIRIITDHYELGLLRCRCIDHQYDLDYVAKSEAATHRLTFEFQGVTTKAVDNPEFKIR